MFFKLLKKDLKRKKGINITIFLFILISAVLAVVCSVQIYAYLTGMERSFERMNTAELTVFQENRVSLREAANQQIEEWGRKQKEVEGYGLEEMCTFTYKFIDIPDFDEGANNEFLSQKHFLVKMPRKYNLVYDTEDKPFYVENGCIALPEIVQEESGVKIGDRIQLTTEMGNTYSFQVSHFFKDVLFPAAYLNGNRFIVSDSDYGQLRTEMPLVTGMYCFKCPEDKAVSLYKDFISQDFVTACWHVTRQDLCGDYMQFAFSSLLVCIAVFLLLIILMTIRFTMISSIQEEQKEIGMMRAIGVDSYRFRWLYTAKYLAFTACGSLMGLALGMPLSDLVLRQFCKNMIWPDAAAGKWIGFLVVTGMILLIGGFCLMVMGRINRISVMEAIRGGSSGERFTKVSKLLLYKRKYIKVPFYLAVSNILNSSHKYLFLIIAYIMGTAIMLLPVHLKNSMTSKEFYQYILIQQVDFYINMNDGFLEEYKNSIGSGTANYGSRGFYEWLNKGFQENDIPAEVGYDYQVRGEYIPEGGGKTDLNLLFGKMDTKKFEYREGTAPELENEIALSYYSARKYGMHIGDRITISLPEYTKDKGTTAKVKCEFVITAFFDYMEEGTMEAVLGTDYDRASHSSVTILSIAVNAPEEEKPAVLERLKEVYGEDRIMTAEEYLSWAFGTYINLFSQLAKLMFVLVAGILFLMTILYSSVLMSGEIASIAMLKSIGMPDGQIRLWQISRMLLMTVVSAAAGVALSIWGGGLFADKLFAVVEMTGFQFVIRPFVTFVAAPGVVLVTVFLAVRLRLRRVKKTHIWEIRED